MGNRWLTLNGLTPPRLSTLHFEADEQDEEEVDAPPILSPPRDILGSSAPRPSGGGFMSIEDQYNILNGRINSLTSLEDGLNTLLHQLLEL